MKVTLIILLLISASAAFPQGSSFKIITVSDGVTIGSTPVTPGMIINQSSDIIKIPQGGFVGLITDDGFLETIRENVEPGKLKKSLLQQRGSVHDDRPVFFPLSPTNDKSEIIGDSIFVFWHYTGINRIPDPPRRFAISNMFDEDLLAIPEQQNWVLVNLSEIRKKEEIVIFGIRGKKKRDVTEQTLIKFKTTRNREMIDMQFASFKNDEDRLFYEFAIYTLNGLYHDRSIPFYKIISTSKVPQDPFLKAYFEQQLKFTRLGLVKLN